MSFLEGKKVYLTAAVTAGIAGAQALGYVVPEWAITLLAAFGLYSVRSAVGKISPLGRII